MARLQLVIRYHADYEDEALTLARRLFAQFDEEIDSLALAPIAGDEFSLTLNGTALHSLIASGRPPRVADVLTALGRDR